MGSLDKRREDILRHIGIAAAKTGRAQTDITVVCVTKYAELSDVVRAVKCGFNVLAENYVQSAQEKLAALKIQLSSAEFEKIEMHLIGHLQTNKAAKAVQFSRLIQSLDSVRLAEKIAECARKLNRRVDVLIQVNISGENTKSGIAPQDTPEFISRIRRIPDINIRGLMGIAEYQDDPEAVRPRFKALKQLFDRARAGFNNSGAAGFNILSMGMSHDYKIAIEEGATMVRIGSAIFGD